MSVERDRLNYANKIIRDFNANLRSADNLVRKHRLCTERAVSRNIKEARSASTVSINDILDAYANTRMLDDPEFRGALRSISDSLNRH